MSEVHGQSDHALPDPMSVLPPEADIVRPPSHVRFVPDSDIKDASHQKKKPPEGGLLNSNLMIVDQAAINAGFDLRR
jgi:hypothetical protein